MARDIGEQMMLAEWLFVESVDDLRRRSAAPAERTRYELLGIAPLLRKLLTDRPSLLNTVKPPRPEVPVAFQIRGWDEHVDKLAVADLKRHFGILGAEMLGRVDTPHASLEELLSTVIGLAEDHELTVKSIIRHYAHVEGGVHFGIPKEPGQSTLSRMAPLLLGHSTGQVQVLAHLGQLVADGLEPMRRSILETPTVHSLLHLKGEDGFFLNHWTTGYLRSRSSDLKR